MNKKILIPLSFFGLIASFVFFRWTQFGSQIIQPLVSQNYQSVYQLKKILKIFDLPYLPFSLSESDLPQYRLQVSSDLLQELDENLPESGLLTNSKSVLAELNYQNKIYPVKIKYRGDKPNHWRFDKKSWRLDFQDQYLDGRRQINLILPEDRGYLAEALALRVAQKMGLLVVDHEFVELYINDRYQGVYLLAEQWGEGVVEKNGLDSDTNLYGEADFKSFPKNIYSKTKYFKKYLFRSDQPEDDFSDLKKLLKTLNDLPDDEFYQQIGTILDIDNFLTWQAHSTLFFSATSNYQHNVNIIFNKAKGKLQFIPWNLGVKDPQTHSIISNYNPLVTRILSNPEWLCRRNQIILDYLNDPDNLSDDLDYLDQLYQLTRKSFYRDGRKDFLNIDFDFRVHQLKKWPGESREKLLQELSYCQENHISTPDLQVFVQNHSGFQINGSSVTLSGSHIFTETIIIPRNTQLTILPGTTLRFMPGTSLVSYSPVIAQGTQFAPILITSATSEPWGAFAIIDTKEIGVLSGECVEYSPGVCGNTSYFEYVTLENAAPAVVNNATFTGGLAVHYSDVEIKNSIFRNNHGDDGANIKYAHVIIQDNQFIDNEFDGLDLDIVTGEVKNNLFANNGNDGLDVSFNQAIIKDNIMRDNNDKCLSIGEQSLAPVSNNTFSNCIMGVAVKDLSDILFENNLIKNNQQGIAVYQKKPIFGGAIVRLKNNQFENNQQDTWTDNLSTCHSER